MFTRKLLSCAVALLLTVFAFVAATHAQSTVDGAVGGVVRDQNQAIVPGATVTTRNVDTNEEKSATADDEGRFRITQLRPGTYEVTITSGSFAPFTQRVVVEVGQVTTLNASLGVTAQGESVEITAEAPVINTTQQDFSTNINQTSINELPINGRRWSNFAILTPGTTPDGNFGLISFRGISGLLNNNTVDGGDNNQAFFSEERGRTRISYVISQSSIREFQVNTSNYSAEYGRAAGGVVNAVTKSGSNEFHGDLFYYIRNNKLGARNPFGFTTALVNNTPTTVALKPEDNRQQFGGSLGGRIVKDKLFFFFSYDQQRRNFPGNARFNRADVFTNPTIAPDRTALRARGVTDAQIDATRDFLIALSGEVPRRGDQLLLFPKIDWVINSNNSFQISYNRLRWDSPNGIQTQATNTRARDNFGDDFVDVDSVNGRLLSTLSPTTTNEFRFQYGRDFETQFSQAPSVPGTPTTGPDGRSPQVFINNVFSFGRPDFLERPAYPDERRIQFADTMTITAGNHTVKFGGDINRVRDRINNLRFLGGEFNYSGTNGLNNFILDYVNFRFGGLNAGAQCIGASRAVGRCYAGNYNQGFGNPEIAFNTTDYNFFVQDDWRFSPRLTLNLGLRYEFQHNPDPQNPNPALPQTSFIPQDKDNFGPRVGFAYDLTGNGRTSLRGGYGIYFGRMINATISNALLNTGLANAGQAQVALNPNTTPIAQLPIFPNILPSAATAGGGAVQFFAPNFEAPKIQQGDLILEREVARNTVVSVSYLLSIGRNLPTFIDTNLSRPTGTRPFIVSGGPFNGQTFTLPVFSFPRPNPRFNQLTEIRSSVRSEYNGLVLQANRRFTDGLQFQTSYTLSKATDTGQTSAAFPSNNAVFDVFDLGQESGTSNFDVRHKFVASAVWTPDFFGAGNDGFGRAVFNGFTISPIFQAFSGRPLTAFVGGSNLNNSLGANRFPLLERNAYRFPKIVNMDLRVSRRFRLGENNALEVLGEAFNIFNRTQVSNLNSTIYTTSGTLSNTTPNVLTFNQPFLDVTEASSTLFRERQIQLAVRFQF